MPPATPAEQPSPTAISTAVGHPTNSGMDPSSLGSDALSAENVRRACTTSRTQRAYRSYRNGIAAWIRESKADADQYFEPGGEIDISMFTPKDFEAFLLAKMNATEKKLKVTTLSGYRSAIKDIYRQKKLSLPAAYMDDMKTFFAGLKRIEAERNQESAGEAKMAGEMALPYSVYERVCKQVLVLNDGGFAHLFLTVQWNLMCRSQSVETIHTGHMSNEDDSIGFVFHKSKANQDGKGPKDPRHVYANPFSPWTCCITALGVYWACYPRQDTGPLFPGSLQRNRFRKAFARALGNADDEKNYGTHSVRKGVATFACNGSTGGPSIVSVCLRCGWSLGGVQDRYFRYEAAGDQFLGRVVAGLPLNSVGFAILPPHFKDNTDPAVREGVKSMFPALASDSSLLPVLKLCLASLVFYSDFLLSQLPTTHSLRGTSIFRSNDLREQLRSRLVQADSPWMTATGIPPQVIMFGLQEEIRATVCALPESMAARFAQLLEENGIRGRGVTQQQLEATLRRVMGENNQTQQQNAVVRPGGDEPRTTVHFWPSDGKLHTLPESFEFPSTDVLHAWHLWWFGNEDAGQPPLKSVSTRDLSTRKKRQTYSEWRVMMQHISTAIERATGTPPPSSMTEQQAAMLCIAGVNSLQLKPSRHTRRPTQLKVTTMLRLVREAEHADNANARTIEFRHRKRSKRD